MRNSNIEKLRILSMIMIVFSHFYVHSNIDVTDLSIIFNRFVLPLSNLGGIGVTLYILITGYFMIDKRFDIKRILKLEFIVIFYSVLSLIICFFISNELISVKKIIVSIFPLFTNHYWFFTTYVVLLLLIPFLNVYLNSISKNNYAKFLLILIFLFIFIPTFKISGPNLADNLLLMITIYSTGGYINKFGISLSLNNIRKIMFSSIFLLIVIVSLIVIASLKFDFLARADDHFLLRHSIFTFIIAVSLFIIYIKKQAYSSNIINFLAKKTFAIYIIHENIFVRQLLWDNLFLPSKFCNGPFLFAYMIFCTIIIFVLCLLIEIIRSNLFDKLNEKLAYKLEQKYLSLEKLLCRSLQL